MCQYLLNNSIEGLTGDRGPARARSLISLTRFRTISPFSTTTAHVLHLLRELYPPIQNTRLLPLERTVHILNNQARPEELTRDDPDIIKARLLAV